VRQHALVSPLVGGPWAWAPAAHNRSVAGATAAAVQPASQLSMSHADAPLVELYAHTSF
jgi:hypothetical protein